MKFAYSLTVFLTLLINASLAADLVPKGTNAPAAPGTNVVADAKPPGLKFTNSVGMELIKVGPFWTGKYEVTQAEYQKIMGANPSEFAGSKQPVENISWNDAVEFCKKMTENDIKKKALPEGFHYCLPTEDEWLSLVGDATVANAVTRLKDRSVSSPQDVGSTATNSLGLCDVRGNVMEFCAGDEDKAYRFLKGGSWKDFVDVNLRTDFHWWCKPDEHQNTFGIRCVLKGAPQQR